MLNRQIGSILRGKATRLQVMLATVLGGTLGFVPGFFLPGDLGGGLAQAPGLILLLLCIVLIANGNLAIFGMAMLVAKLLSWPLLSVSYWLGTVLIDGPLQGLFRWLCNSQVTAWFGLEHYATTGGLVLGVVFGVSLGLLINRALKAVRNRMAGVEENSERYQKYAGKWWVRLLSWAFLGKGKGKKKTWKQISESQKMGLPVRILGVLVAVAFTASIFVFQQWFSTPILTTNLRLALESGNGATVDLDSASLSIGEGVIRVKNLALADSADLGRDLLAADELVMTIDTSELLRRRLVIDEIKAINARAGTRRSQPGVILESGEPEPAAEPPVEGVPTIDEYLKDYELWKGRLEQVREWVEVVFAEGDATGEPKTVEEIAADREAQIESVGLAGVIATHLFESGPRVLIRKVDIEGITWTRDGVEEQVALRMRNISSDPSLLTEAPAIGFATASQSFALSLSGPSAGNSGIGLSLQCRGLAVDKLFAGFKSSGESVLRGGTVDFDVSGSLGLAVGKAMTMDLPLAVTLRDTTLALGGRQTPLQELALPIGLRGAVNRPSVYFDDKALSQALLAAGKQELANFVSANAGKLLGKLPGELQGALQGVIDPDKAPEEMAAAATKKLEEEAKKKLEAEKQKAQKALEEKARNELNKVLPGGLGGLLGGKKKKD